jgi:outer membrane receptor protein involved in Fe transport
MRSKKILPNISALSAAAALGLLLIPQPAAAQLAPNSQVTTTTTTTSSSDVAQTSAEQQEPALVLSPFVVDANEDQGSYKANSTLAGTRVRTNLEDVASSISVVTAQFLQDTGATDNESLLIYAMNTQVGGLNGNFASNQAGNFVFSENLISPETNTRVRGLATADNTRDYFQSDIPADFFDVGRVDLQRGPNSILFGTGSPGGIINTSINEAEYVNSYKISNTVDQYGSLRDSADLNYVIIPNTLAIRIGLLQDDAQYEQKPAFNNQKREFGALSFDKDLLGKGNHTSVRVKYEAGSVDANNPRTLPPNDQITSWYALGKPTWNDWQTPNQGYGVQFESQGEINLLGVSSAAAVIPQGETYYPDVKSYFNGVAAPGQANVTVQSGIPTTVIVGTIPASFGGFGVGTYEGIGDLPLDRPFAIPGLNELDLNNGTPGGAYYSDKVITDPSIFNFYKSLLDGPNKKEWQDWKATNVAVSQTFFHDTLAFQLVYDTQHYTQGENNIMQGEDYAISVEINDTFPDGSANPNVGRPYAAGDGAIGNDSETTDRSSLRFTATYEFDADRFFKKDSWITKVLGKSIFTGLFDEDKKKEQDITWNTYETTTDWATLNGISPTITQGRLFDWLTYLGPNLLGTNSPSGANIPGIQTIISPSASTSVLDFNTHYTNTAVNPSAPFSFYSYNTGTIYAGDQGDNPANYAGWQQTAATWLNANNASDFPQMVTGGNKTSYSDVNQGFTWQGFLFEGTLVPTIGYRKDEITNYVQAAPSDPVTGVYATQYTIDPGSRVSVTGESHAWGGVYHLPRFLTDKLPFGIKPSLYYDQDQNFKAEAPALSVLGLPEPNPDGHTKEYGITISALNDKISLKVGHYKTILENDPVSYAVSYYIEAAPVWSYVWASEMQDYLGSANNPTLQNNLSGLFNYASGDGVAGSAGGPGNPGFDNAPETALEKQIIGAWQNIGNVLPESFWTSYPQSPYPINPALSKSTGILANGIGGGYMAGVTDNISGGYNPGYETTPPINRETTETSISSGIELEVAGQIARNWNISLNYSTSNATRTSIDPATTQLMTTLNTFFNGPGGQIRQWYNAGPTLGPAWISAVYDPYLTLVNQQGQRAPDLPQWQGNVTSTYNFDRGPLKGAFVGGALRLEGSRILGYHYDPTLNGGLGGLNVGEPWNGPQDTHFDAWLGYERALFSTKVKWRIQLNMTNVGEKDHLVPAAYEPDGSLALARIQLGMGWRLTNTFEF